MKKDKKEKKEKNVGTQELIFYRNAKVGMLMEMRLVFGKVVPGSRQGGPNLYR